MATLQDYLGITALRDAWPKWKANVIAINNQVIAHIAGTADKHSAQDITYTGDFVGKTEVKAALDQAKTEIDTIVVNASIDPEVALARDSTVKSETFGTLDARLESSEQDFVSYQADNTTQLALKVDKVVGKGLSTNDYDAAEKAEVAKIVLKANIADVNTQIASVVSGSPKGTYTTVLALTTAIPAGDANIYLVTADGNWYYWIGSAWTAGGVYQATGIADTSVGYKQLDSLIASALYSIDSGTSYPWEFGTIDAVTGAVSGSATNRIRSSILIKVSKNTLVINNSIANIKLGVYIYSASNMSYISSIIPDNIAEKVIDQDCFVRLVALYNDNAVIVTDNIPAMIINFKIMRRFTDGTTLLGHAIDTNKLSTALLDKLYHKGITPTWSVDGLANGILNGKSSNVVSSLINVETDLVVELLDPTYVYNFARYDASDNWIVSSDWLTAPIITLALGYHYRISIKPVSSPSVILASEIPANVASIKLTGWTTAETIPDGMDVTAYMQSCLDTNGTFILEKSGTFWISDIVKIPSNAHIKLGSNTVIKSVSGTNKSFLENDDPLNVNENVHIEGGIWDGNRSDQTFDTTKLWGIFRFAGVKNLYLGNLIIREPVSFGTQFCRLENYLIENITFDSVLPITINNDGVHLGGECYHGRVINIKGNTGDDMIALNADDYVEWRFCNDTYDTQMVNGPIVDLVVDGVHADDGYRMIRMLSGLSLMDDITVTNVTGKYNLGILIGRWLATNWQTVIEGNGNIGRLNISKISAVATSDDTIVLDGNAEYIRLSDFSPNYSDMVTSKAIVKIAQPDITVKHLNISDVYVKNTATNTVKPLVNAGVIGDLIYDNYISDTVQTITNTGTITKFRSNSFTL